MITNENELNLMQTHYLVGFDQVGKTMAEALKFSLCEISMFAQIQVRTEATIADIPQSALESTYSAILVGYKSFSDIPQLPATVPHMVANSYGVYGSVYTHLGGNFECEQVIKTNKKKDNGDEVIERRNTVIRDSLSLNDFVAQKVVDYDQVSPGHLNRHRNFKKFDKPLLYALTTLYSDEMAETQDIEATKLRVTKKFIETNRGKLLLVDPTAKEEEYEYNKDYSKVLNHLVTMSKEAEFNPTNSVLGCTVSQEIQKIITRQDVPMRGLFLYDSDKQNGVVLAPDFQDL